MVKISQRSPSQHQDPAPLNDQQATVQDTLCQTTSKTGTQPHPLAQRLTKIIRPQTPQNTPPDMDLPTRKTDPASSTRTQALVPSTRKPTQPTEPTKPTGDRHQKQRKLRTCSLGKGDPKHTKLNKQMTMTSLRVSESGPRDYNMLCKIANFQ